jgi:uncharacterized protein
MAYNKPLPKIDALNRPFWEAAREGRLVVQTCGKCGDVHMPPTPVCPACLSDGQEWRAASGRGTLESWITFHRAYWDGFKDELPYNVCLVRLEEGPLLVSNLVGPAERAKAGAAVRAMFRRVTEEVTLPVFELIA